MGFQHPPKETETQNASAGEFPEGTSTREGQSSPGDLSGQGPQTTRTVVVSDRRCGDMVSAVGWTDRGITA